MPKYLVSAGDAIIYKHYVLRAADVVDMPDGLLATFSTAVQARFSASVAAATVTIASYHAPTPTGFTYLEKTVTTGSILAAGGTYDVDLALDDIVIEKVSVTRTAGTGTDISIVLYDDDPGGAGAELCHLMSGAAGTALTLVGGAFDGPQVGGDATRPIMQVPAGAWMRVTNDDGANPATLRIVLTYRAREAVA